MFDLFRSFVVAFFFLEREERRGTLLRERRLSSLATSINIIALLYKKNREKEFVQAVNSKKFKYSWSNLVLNFNKLYSESQGI